MSPADVEAKIKELATKDALTGISDGTANLLAFNGADEGSDPEPTTTSEPTESPAPTETEEEPTESETESESKPFPTSTNF